MRSQAILSTAASIVCLSAVLATATDPQANPRLEHGTFEAPSPRVRPRFRYWLPDASVNHSQVVADVQEAKRVGAGGIELLGYYNYGDAGLIQSTISTDWTKYGWGTSEWSECPSSSVWMRSPLLTTTKRTAPRHGSKSSEGQQPYN